MKSYNATPKLMAVLLTAMLALTFAANNSSSLAVKAQQGSDDAPILEYQKAVSKPAARKSLNRRHTLRQDKPLDELPAGIEPLPLPSRWWVGLPALPVTESDAIVFGEVTSRCAGLTEDKMGVYSEFSVQLERIFKDQRDLLTAGGTVTAFRPGGTLRFGSGKIQRYTVSKQGYPQQGRRYVLFLKVDEQGDFSILTGYELDGLQVRPLDGNSTDPRNDLQFGIYDGVRQESFLNELQRSLKAAECGIK